MNTPTPREKALGFIATIRQKHGLRAASKIEKEKRFRRRLDVYQQRYINMGVVV